MKNLADFIISHTGNSEWAMAMRREFDELENGHLGWALGSVGAVCLKDVRENWLFFVALILSAYFMVAAYPALASQIFSYDASLYADYFFYLDHFGQIPLAAALGFWRPTRALTIMLLGGFLFYTVGGILFIMHDFGGNIWELLSGEASYQVMGISDENVWVATAVDLLVWYLAARLGGQLRRLFLNNNKLKPQS